MFALSCKHPISCTVRNPAQCLSNARFSCSYPHSGVVCKAYYTLRHGVCAWFVMNSDKTPICFCASKFSLGYNQSIIRFIQSISDLSISFNSLKIVQNIGKVLKVRVRAKCNLVNKRKKCKEKNWQRCCRNHTASLSLPRTVTSSI